MNGQISVLLGQMSQELEDLQHTADRAAQLLAQAKQSMVLRDFDAFRQFLLGLTVER